MVDALHQSLRQSLNKTHNNSLGHSLTSASSLPLRSSMSAVAPMDNMHNLVNPSLVKSFTHHMSVPVPMPTQAMPSQAMPSQAMPSQVMPPLTMPTDQTATHLRFQPQTSVISNNTQPSSMRGSVQSYGTNITHQISSAGSVQSSSLNESYILPTQHGHTNMRPSMRAVQETPYDPNKAIEPEDFNNSSETLVYSNVPYSAANNQTNFVATSPRMQHQYSNLEDDCGQEEFPGGNSYSNSHQAGISRVDSSDGKEEFPGGNTANTYQHQRRMNMSVTSIYDGKEDQPSGGSSHIPTWRPVRGSVARGSILNSSITRGSILNSSITSGLTSRGSILNSSIKYQEDDGEDFPGGNNLRNYGAPQQRNFPTMNVPQASVDTRNDVKQDFPGTFYDLESNEPVPLRGSFLNPVNKNKHQATARNSLYHPDLHKGPGPVDRRRSSVMVAAFLERLQDFDDSSDSEPEEDFRSKRKFRDSSSAVNHLRGSLRESLKLDDIFQPDNKRVDRRRSKRVSLLLRQSLISSWANVNDAPINNRGSMSLPDLFDTKVDRRRSIITESSHELLRKVLGAQKDLIPSGCEKDILKEILDPHSTDVLMRSILSVASLDESIGSDFISDNGGGSLNNSITNSTLNPKVATGMMNLNMGHS